MFVLHPDPYLQPAYRISPFKTEDVTKNNSFASSEKIDDYFSKRFSDKQYHYTETGRTAINIALSQHDLQLDDVVTIFTTTNNFYVSGCITKEIEKFCKWSRKIEPNTKLIFLNHEFGYPIKNAAQYLTHNLPIIEDCCHCFFSKNLDNSIGNIGDFVIFSFPKMFPIQIGGLLVSKNKIHPLHGLMSKEQLVYTKNVLSFYVTEEKEIIEKRKANYNYLLEKINSNNFSPRFDSDELAIPGVFMFRVINKKIDLAQLKLHFYAHGVQCSVFYGEETFFIPVHQGLNNGDLDYFIEILNSF